MYGFTAKSSVPMFNYHAGTNNLLYKPPQNQNPNVVPETCHLLIRFGICLANFLNPNYNVIDPCIIKEQ